MENKNGINLAAMEEVQERHIRDKNTRGERRNKKTQEMKEDFVRGETR